MLQDPLKRALLQETTTPVGAGQLSGREGEGGGREPNNIKRNSSSRGRGKKPKSLARPLPVLNGDDDLPILRIHADADRR